MFSDAHSALTGKSDQNGIVSHIDYFEQLDGFDSAFCNFDRVLGKRLMREKMSSSTLQSGPLTEFAKRSQKRRFPAVNAVQVSRRPECIHFLFRVSLKQDIHSNSRDNSNRRRILSRSSTWPQQSASAPKARAS